MAFKLRKSSNPIRVIDECYAASIDEAVRIFGTKLSACFTLEDQQTGMCDYQVAEAPTNVVFHELHWHDVWVKSDSKL